jgi:hypothetical protein
MLRHTSRKALQVDVRFAHLKWLRRQAARQGRREFLLPDRRKRWEQRLDLIRALATSLSEETTTPSPAGVAGSQT